MGAPSCPPPIFFPLDALAMSWDDKKPKRKKEWSHPVRQDKDVPLRPRA
nr:MAG TPA: hypothetical protein [Caudoviricetes sp.]